MTSDVEICSAALLMVGAEDINSFEDESREAKLCSALYATTVKDMLQQHPWRFSMGQEQLARLAATPLYGYSYAYQLPSGCLRVLSTESDLPYQIFENKLYTDAETVQVTYQFRPDEARFPAYFVRVLEYELAAILAVSLTADESKSALFRQYREAALRKARNTDSQQQPTRGLRDVAFPLTYVRL